jgi:hypothetical protein
MSDYLSEIPIWHEPNPTIMALDGKEIMIEDEGSLVPAWIAVDHADPNGSESGRCSVSVNQSNAVEIHQGDASRGVPPTSQIHSWREYLSQTALDLIRPRTSRDSCLAELSLVVPSEEVKPK